MQKIPYSFLAHRKELGKNSSKGALIKNFILGGQDGLVNVLGIVLGVAIAANDVRIVIIAGMAALIAESISMAAVAYTSIKASKEYYASEVKREKLEIETLPEIERKEIEIIYKRKGFSGKDLKMIVDRICSNKKVWLKVMMDEELGLSAYENFKPFNEAIVVGLSSVFGSIVPLAAFFFVPIISIHQAMLAAVILTGAVLFATGALKAKMTVGKWWKSGAELLLIGVLSGIAGFAIGALLGA